MHSKEEIYYCQPVFRPPSEAYSLLIQLTEGCTFKCDFCMSNLRKKFVVRDVKLIKKDLDVARKKYGPNVRTKYAYSLFPNLERCGVYAHSKDILKKSDEQLKMLFEAGLKIAYVGFESGSDPLLEMVHKQANKSDHIRASKKLMKSGITLSATFINGLGGGNNPEISKDHAIESADLVNKICPNDDRIWYIAFLTLMVPSGTEIFKKKLKGEFQDMNSIEILQELKTFIINIDFQNKNATCIFRSNHASNYLPIKGILDREKDEILSTLNYGITHSNILRPEFYRGL
jgi:radical SAM superfamily enzyme YgiQ (UPF0313 family)